MTEPTGTSNIRLSNSELATFRRCKRKWWLNTYRRLKPIAGYGYNTPIHIGNVVHDALAAYYEPSLRTDPVLYAKAIFDEELAANPAYEIEILEEWSLVEPMLVSYIDWLEETGADQNLRFLGSERMVEVPLYDQHVLISKLDATVEQISDGAKLALEHKTVGDLETPMHLLKIDTQLLTEHLVRYLDAQAKGSTQEEALDDCHGILYNMLKKNKRTSRSRPPFFKREIIPHNAHELNNHWRHVMTVALEMDRMRNLLDLGGNHHEIVPPSPMKTCKWECEFFKVCHMFDDGSQVESALEAMYEEHDPLERYAGTEHL